ncbi:VPLPA-CTERM sorting domain-containing protein [Tateyamaria sp. Alg231-49]|uniref:VPLPA-CTERM sorting domain-containing protein n=1 Tax=Tateyamaria sp. Alg231-49 TaxID=1922219 RepID=UPI000D55038A|nr:VPLPA-CTERM sorting domain-containing protein [Tateyamaria sp. Alg231-49]
MKYLSSASIGAIMMSAATMSSAATVDFEGFSSGDVLAKDVNLGGGIVADISAFGGTNQAVIFDTDAVTGGDVDLASPFANSVSGALRGFGNILIVQENAPAPGDPIVPDDAVGGTLIFDFATLISLTEVFLIDTAQGSFVSLLLDGAPVQTQAVVDLNVSDTSNVQTPNEFTLFDFGGAVGDMLIVSYSESGAVGEFKVSVVPVPASLLLLIGGFGLMALMRSRSNA